MLLSIIVATFNSEMTLKQTLDSIRYQTFKDYEVIVIDGASTDGTMKIVEEYKDIVSKYISETDTGIYNAFNKGLYLAEGEYVTFLGSDDCYCDYKVFSDLKTLFKSENIDFLSAPVFMVNENSKQQRIFTNRISKEEILHGEMIPHQGVFVKTSIMKSFGFNEKYKISADQDFVTRYVFNGGEIKYIDRFVVFYSDAGISSAKPGSSSWIRSKYEQIDLLYSIGIKDPYNVFHFCSSFYLKELVKPFLKKLKIQFILSSLFGITRRHHCDLKYCRWCKRN